MRIQTMIAAFLFGLLAGIVSAHAQDTPIQTQQKSKQKTQEQIYGSHLMTEEERTAHMEKMRTAKMQEERDKIRLEHHKAMQERAKAKGITLPDEPMGRCGKGPGHGAGAGGPMPGRCGDKKGR